MSELHTDIEKILHQVAKSLNIDNYEFDIDLEVQTGDGFVAHFYFADVINKITKEVTRVAIKKCPPFQSHFSAVFNNEVIFYSTFFTKLNELQNEVKLPKRFDNVAQLYSTGMEPGKEFLAMENLTERGYVLFDKEKYWDQEHLNFIFEVYGRFHALGFMYNKRHPKNYEEVSQMLKPFFWRFITFMDKQLAAAFTKTLGGLDPSSRAYEDLKDIPENIVPMFRRSLKYDGQYKCITHGDCWSNNMMFKYSESGKLIDMKLLDFQLSIDDSFIHDLSYFFYSGASKHDLNRLEEYLKVYHASFSQVLRSFGEDPDKIFPFEVLVAEWKQHALFGLILGTYVWLVKLVKKEQCSEELNNSEHAKGSKADMFKRLTENVSVEAYRERTVPILIHAHEFGVLTKEKVVQKDSEEEL